MDLQERYAQLHNGIRFAIETIEDAYRLPPPLEEELHHWVISEWESRRSSIDWCDNDQDLLTVTSNLTHLAQSYQELRKRLFSDLYHFGPEPPWRRVHHTLAVRLPVQFHHSDSEYYILQDRGMNRWTFHVHGWTRSENGEREPTVREFEVELTGRSCRIPDELEGDRLLDQLFYGLMLMKDEHYYMRTLRDEVVMEAERIVHAEEDDGHGRE
ncbi:hypothetical protein ACQEU5_13915 [Marinactinospora thermotolerans]|uniref:Uncharacterized protein n=1 Tax=Marinactinospora thermotolerans DSM 45154 TaxID=1122192 RepID=A0A1T4RVP6_9ACTN|nr:hypothetical protein [Marinactinospora thermotolerans]SKA20043.1 hypothetical protein SAMN02745673_03036 [Marinactinospora thermotolerans DSM 45154]